MDGETQGGVFAPGAVHRHPDREAGNMSALIAHLGAGADSPQLSTETG